MTPREELETLAADDLLSRAIILATEAHRGQVDKGGNPYILHPLRVMGKVFGADYQMAAVLHDTVEDCGLELALIRHRFGNDVADAVDALTRRDGESYEAFIDRCGGNRIARVVKLADIADNMDLSRLGREPTPADFRRRKKYVAAKGRLRARASALTGYGEKG